MGSHFKALTANMKTFLLAFTLLMLGLHGSKADKVTSCLQCTSHSEVEDSECIEGTVTGTACGKEMDGCYVNVEGDDWIRGCCAGALCTEAHEEAGDVGPTDQTWCATNDCNTGILGTQRATAIPWCPPSPSFSRS